MDMDSEANTGGQQMDRDDEGQKQSPDDVAASRGRPRRSGEGMDSVRQHLRDHLRRQVAEQPGDDASQAEG